MAPIPDGLIHYPPVPDRMLNCDLYLTSIGRMDYPPQANYPSGRHPSEYNFDWHIGRRLNDFALVWISAGSGEMELREGHPSPLTKNSAILITPGRWHRYRPHFQTGWREHWICLNGEHLHRLRIRGFLPSSNLNLGAPRKLAWQKPHEDLLRLVSANPQRNNPVWGALGLQILLVACSPWEPGREDSSADTLLDRALACIRERAHRPLKVDQLAFILQTSRRTLERHFSLNHMRSPRREIIQVRLERASRMLGTPEIPIKEIAYSCGFGSQKLMNYNFQRFLGKTPGKLRSELLERQSASSNRNS